MCLQKGCNSYKEIAQSYLTCNCNESCYSCYSANKYCGESWYAPCSYELSHTDVRKKYVCFPCKRIWKSSFSKYIVNRVGYKDGYEAIVKELNKLDKNEPVNVSNDPWASYELVQKCKDVNYSNPYSRSEKRNLKYLLLNKYQGLYLTNKSNCAQCGNDGIIVGRNFRHCKSDKEWKELEKKYKDNKCGLVNDFYDYPREGTEESATKLQLKPENKYARMQGRLSDAGKTAMYNC